MSFQQISLAVDLFECLIVTLIFYSRLKFKSILSLMCQTLLWRILTCLDFFTSQAYMQASVPCYSKFHVVRNWLTRFI